MVTRKCFLLVLFVTEAFLTQAQDGQRYASLGDFTLASGQILQSCQIGYRTFGKLNQERTNVILFPTWFSGQSKSLTVLTAPGGLADSTQYFVVLVDALGNGISTSPSNSAQQPFPQLSIRDMVQSQYTLLTQHLKLQQVYAVMGVSMGGMQALQWMVSYPTFMKKIISIVGTPQQTAYDKLLWHTQLEAIEQVKRQGLDAQAAMPVVNMIHTLHLFTPKNRATQISNADEYIAKTRKEREHPDADDWAAQLQAMLSHDIYRESGRTSADINNLVKAKVLVVVATQDQMVNPIPSITLAKQLNAQLLELTGDCGHMASGCEAKKMAEVVRYFLKN